MEVVKLMPMSEAATLPTRGSRWAAGMDLKASASYCLNPGVTLAVKTDWNIEIPEGYVGLVCSRSGMALKNSVFALNAPGVVDEDYRGEIQVILHNAGQAHVDINKGDRIAQLLLVKAVDWEVEITDQLSESERGANGFGSTGK